MDIIRYNDKVKYKNKIGIVKEASASFAKVLFEDSKKLVMLPVEGLEKIDD